MCEKEYITILSSVLYEIDRRKDEGVDYYYTAIDWKARQIISFVKGKGCAYRKETKILGDINYCPFCGRGLKEENNEE